MRTLTTLAISLLLVVGSGCSCSDGGSGDVDGSTGGDGSMTGMDGGGPPADGSVGRDAWVAEDSGDMCDGAVIIDPSIDVALDLLFVVDSSGSMAEEQASLIEQFPRLVTALETGDLDGDGALDFAPVSSLRIGVVTTDLGGGAVRGAGCPVWGDDAILRTGATPPPAGCDATYPPFMTFTPGGTVPLDEFVADISCVAEVGAGGCGIEQPLEAALKALTPATSALRFAGGSTGHADGANAGFRRPEAILGIIFVTDEDDCSIADESLWDPESTRYTGDVRCSDYQDEALHGLERFVDGYRAVEPDPDRLVVAAITGVPVDLLTADAPPDYERILSDPRMEQVHNPADPTHVIPSCNVPGRGIAEPPRRVVELVRRFGPGGTVASICQADFTPVLTSIIDRLGRAIRRVECR